MWCLKLAKGPDIAIFRDGYACQSCNTLGETAMSAFEGRQIVLPFRPLVTSLRDGPRRCAAMIALASHLRKSCMATGSSSPTVRYNPARVWEAAVTLSLTSHSLRPQVSIRPLIPGAISGV